MLDEIKVNLLDLIFNNLGTDTGATTKTKGQNTDTTMVTSKLEKDSFGNVMNNLQGKNNTELKDNNSQGKFEINSSKKIDAKKALETVKQVSKDLKSSISDTESAKDSKPLDEVDTEAEEETKESDTEENQLMYLVLDTMKQQVNLEIEDLTKAIASLDLSNPEGIEAILELSDRLDALRAIETELLSQIEDLGLPSHLEIGIEDIELTQDTANITFIDSDLPGIELELEQVNPHKLEAIIHDKVKDLIDLKLASSEQGDMPTELKPNLDVISNNLKTIKQLKTDSDNSDSNPLLELAKIENVEIKAVKVEKAPINAEITKNLLLQERVVVDEPTNMTEQNQEFVVTLGQEPSLNSEMSDMEADSFASNNAPQEELVQISTASTQEANVFKVNSKIQIHKTPVSINQLPNLLSREATKVNPGGSQEITMSLTPGDLGQIELSISRGANNKLEIKMVFSQDNAMNSVEHKLTELRSILRSRGFEAHIELSKSESSNTETYNQASNNSFNEAREEQKDRILDTMPEWLRPDESSISTSFESTLNGIL